MKNAIGIVALILVACLFLYVQYGEEFEFDAPAVALSIFSEESDFKREVQPQSSQLSRSTGSAAETGFVGNLTLFQWYIDAATTWQKKHKKKPKKKKGKKDNTWKEVISYEKPKLNLILTEKSSNNLSMIAAYEFPHEITVTFSSLDDVGTILYCHYFDSNGIEIGGPFESFIFPQYVVNCGKRNGAVKISLSTRPDVSPAKYSIPIIDRTSTKPTHFFSVCLSTIYGDEPKWLFLAELIEHYKIQGATHFYIYILKIDEYSRKLLDDYARTGDIEIVVLSGKPKRGDGGWQMVEYHDCTVRARLHSKHVAFVDLDERLTPTEYPGTIVEFLREEHEPKIGAFIFRQQWVLKNDTLPEEYESVAQIKDWMPSNRYHNSSAFGPNGHTAKCIIDPLKVFQMWVHAPSTFYPGYRGKFIKSDVIVVRHYRDVKMGNWGDVYLKGVLKFGNMTLTNYPEKYRTKLERNVIQRIRFVYESW